MSLRFQGVGGGGTRAGGEVTQKWLSWECVLGGPCLGLSDRPECMAEELSPLLPPSRSLVSAPEGTQSELSSDRATRKKNLRWLGATEVFEHLLICVLSAEQVGPLGSRPHPHPRAPASPWAQLPSMLVLSAYSCSVLTAVSLRTSLWLLE